MTETQQRIQAYKKALPHMKERVMAVALLLAMSAAMMASASFAWVTLSRAPEVNGLATTVSTNGNLEIALSDIDGLQPNESGVTDGSGNITQSNLTWGNLINLSDASYGLDKIVLRPASLNTTALLTSPVTAIEYDSDGRIKDYITDFAYTNYDSTLKAFGVPDTTQYGIRAISSVTYKDITGNQFLVDQVDLIKKYYSRASDDFKAVYGNDEFMTVIGKLVEVYAEVILSGANPDCTQTVDMEKMALLMDEFMNVIDEIGWVYVEIANLHYYQTLQDATLYDPYELSDLVNGKIPEEFTKDNTYLSTYLTIYKDAVYADNGIQAAADIAEQSQPVYWSSISNYVDKLCKMSTATINGYTVSELLSAISQAVSNVDIPFLFGLMGWDDVPAVINGGVLKDVDQFLNGQFSVKSGTFEVFVTYPDAPVVGDVSMKLHPSVTTAAYNNPPFYLNEDVIAAEKAASGGTSLKGDAVAAETYAMAIDLWVRTNQDDALLILEGEVIYAQATGTNEDGKPVGLLYSYTVTDSQTQQQTTVYVYQDENKNWFYDYTRMGKNDQINAADVPSNIEVVYSTTPIGYEGVNRVWNELDDPNSNAASMLPSGSVSTTQGSGSCYVFYPQSVEDQNQCLKLLAAMQVAFVDEKGNLLAKAYMDTTKAVEESGRVIVPLQLYANTPIPVDDDGNTERYYISKLTRNEAMRVTALIYLDGTNLTNKDVLSAGSITGQLNLQFGTSQVKMEPMDNTLKQESYSIDFVQTKFTFEDTDKDFSIDLKMILDGLTPKKVSGSFLSVINATQGAKQKTFTLNLNEESGYYEAKVTFDGPGNYQLRSIQMDGVDYALDDIVYVTVPGERVTELVWGDGVEGNKKTVLTAEPYYQQTLNLTLKKMSENVSSVRGVFLGDNGSNIVVNFTSENGEDYIGTATFNSSGIYELTYVYINDAVSALEKSMYKTIDVSLGLRTEVQLVTPYFDPEVSEEDQARIMTELTFERGKGYSFVYTGEEPLNFDIHCYIYNDQGDLIEGLEGVVLNYSQGSVTNALDATVKWDEKLGYYTGTFDFQSFGIFTFQNLVVNKTSYVTKTTMAHSITAISTDPMAYIPSNPEPLVFNLGAPATDRTLSLKLANASAATLEITVANADKSVTEIYKSTENQIARYTDETTGITTFTVQLPDDGQWTITDARVSTVFYDDNVNDDKKGVFYAGGENAIDWLDLKTVPGWQNDLTTQYVTELTVSVNSKAESYSFESLFMEKTFSIPEGDLTLSFLAYDDKPITYYADQAGVQLDVNASTMYTWSYNTLSNISATPDPVGVTGNGTLTESNPRLTLDTADFEIDGNYVASNLTVTVNGREYIVSGLPKVAVKWTVPEVKFTNVEPAPSKGIDVDTGNSTTTKYNSLSDYNITCYYAASQLDRLCNYTPSSATAELSKAGTNYDSATCTIDGTGMDVVFTFSATGEETAYSTQDIGKTGTSRTFVGTNASATAIVLEYGNVEYTFTLQHTLYVTCTE